MGSDFELKISPTRDDFSSTFKFQLAKGTATPLFFSNETNSMFILTAKLTGFATDDIVITINGSGTRIEISWGKPIRKVEITGRTYKKETETRRFKKIFRIPDSVVLDEIKATYDDKESILKISMPKSVDGMLGVGIEEVKDQEADEATFESQDYEDLLETLETGRKTNLVDDIHEKEEDHAINGVVEEENAEPQAFHKIEYVAEMQPEEIEKLKGSEMDQDTDGESNNGHSQTESKQTVKVEARRENVNGEIKVPKITSMDGIEVAEGTANYQNEKQLNAEPRNGDKATMINKKPYVKTQSQASTDPGAQVLDRELSQPNRLTRAEPGKQETYKNVRELNELETNKEPEDIGSPHLQSPAHQHDEKEVDRKGRSFQTKDEIKDARQESKSTHEGSSNEAKQEKKQDSKQFKMRTPIIIAGSALLASLVIVVFNLVKNKRREKNMRG